MAKLEGSRTEANRFDEIADWFDTVARAERSHAGRLTAGLDNLS